MEKPATTSAHSGHVASVAFPPDGQALVSAGMDNTVKPSAVPSWKPVRTLEGHEKSVNTASFSPEGPFLASASTDTTAKLWASPLYEGSSVQGHSLVKALPNSDLGAHQP
jgi:WD40 repeat protein